MKNKFILLATLAIGFASCEPEFENSLSESYTAGEADFSSYVSVGNSLTAGYMDGTVSKGSQMNSYPNLLAQQFALVGGGAFTQPSYEDDVNNLGGFLLGGSPILVNGVNQFPTRLVIDASQVNPDGSVGAVEYIAGTSTVDISNIHKGPYNNMGVPGAKTFHLLAAGYGNIAGVQTLQSNPYFVRMASDPNATVLGDAMAKAPTFFTNWIGNNDVLAYATSGGVGVDQNAAGNTNPATYGPNDITNANTFANVYSTIVNTLTSNGAKGVVCTIPSVTSIPFFTTVPYNPLTAKAIGQGNEAAGAAAIAQINVLYGQLKQALTAFGAGNRINLLNANGPNPLLIKDETLPNLSAQLTAAFTPSLGAATAAFYGNVFGQARQATFLDKVLLKTRLAIGAAPTALDSGIGMAPPSPLNKFGITYPLQDAHILIPTELTSITNATNSYNASIKAIAASKGLAVADMNAIMNNLISGLRVDSGQTYTANYFNGSATESKVLFSLDGVHPNARGYAVIANEIIKVINAKYKSNLPLHVPSYFPGINILGTN